MCDFTPDMPKVPAAPPPMAPSNTARLSVSPTTKGLVDQLTGQPLSKRKRGLSSLTIERDSSGASGLTIGE